MMPLDAYISTFNDALQKKMLTRNTKAVPFKAECRRNLLRCLYIIIPILDLYFIAYMRRVKY